jgi:uncharacterized lipoprotein YehR (DUF1307 family)
MTKLYNRYSIKSEGSKVENKEILLAITELKSSMDKRYDALEKLMDKRLDSVEEQLYKIGKKLDAKGKAAEDDVDHAENLEVLFKDLKLTVGYTLKKVSEHDISLFRLEKMVERNDDK